MNKNSMMPALLTSAAMSLCAGTAYAEGADAPAAASTAGAPADVGDIIVTARKRDETSISVPVVVSAVGAQELQRRAINNLDGIARTVPQLIIGPQGGSVQGGNFALRGVSGPDSNPFGDQAVSFNIDGVQVAKGNLRRVSDTDIAQVEVLKGPQALFFGKNSPAGIISIRTADPGSHFEAMIRTGYEFEGREIRTEGYVSGPINDKLGVRLSGYFGDLNGYLKNNIPDNAYVRPTSSARTPKGRDYAARLTLKWEPTDNFNARLKVNYARTETTGPAGATGYIFCPQGSPQTGITDDCRANDHVINPGSGPVVGTINPKFKDGRNYLNQDQVLAGLEMNYHPSDNLTVTSVTGLYYVNLIQAQNYENDYNVALPSTNNLKDRELSQELRLQSNYDGPLNFTAGVYLSNTWATTGSTTYLFATEAAGLPILAANGLGFVPLRTPFQINNYQLTQKGQAYSAFLQLSWKPIDVIEVNVGGRYSYERKRLTKVQSQAIGSGNPFAYVPLSSADDIPGSATSPRKDSWKDFSPEITLSYRPTSNLTFFGSYKHGFLSGGFNSGSTDFTQDLTYDQQSIKGFEAGVKALVLHNRLRLNLAGYTYSVSNLQVQNYINATNFIRNAASVRVKGIEFDFNYRFPLEGLSVRGAAAYNKAVYTSFPNAPCYNGQTIALGCTIVDGNPAQNLAGQTLPRAPRWSLSGGIMYETALSAALKLGLSVDANYSSKIFTDVTNAPGGVMPHYALLDATVRLSQADDRWELAFIGRNLTNKFYYVASTDVPFTGSAAGGATGVLGDRYAAVARGRELMARVTYKFGTR
ncbi:TonB-dependent receptor [Flavisphingomonas formosensis]|uniref:TonB-dependent receptor n=1 Tax=Flavisphingomonas formosensis TaxID=861534 RepID=UPI0012FC202B|nr:TonB-dependent receptor [Sphingomonas formosensis]